MMRPIFLLSVMVWGAGLGALRAGEEPIEGIWVGEVRIAGQCLAISVRFRNGAEGLEGTVNVPAQVIGMRLSEVHSDPSAVRFRVELGNALCEGKREDGSISGSVFQGPLKGTFLLQRVPAIAKVDASRYDDYVGTYGPGNAGIVVSHEGDYLLLKDRELFPSEGDVFLYGLPNAKPGTSLGTCAFLRGADGRVEKARLREGESELILDRQPAPFVQREIRFQSGKESLSGTLFIPSGQGPYPAVAMVHGSGAQGRRSFASVAAAFASKGIAALAYDKRGVGSSTGDWTRASYDDLAGDALAAVQALRGAAGVDPARTGLCGISQAGWIIPIAAARSRDVAFAVLLSAPAVTGKRQFLTGARGRLEAGRFPKESVERGLAFADLLLRAAKEDTLRPELEAAVARFRNEAWFRVAFPMDGQPLDSVLAQLRASDLDQDPAEALRKVLCPVLALWGGEDRDVPPDENLPAMKAALEQGGNGNVTLKVYPGANHGLCMPDGKSSPSLMGDMTGWILKQAGNGGR